MTAAGLPASSSAPALAPERADAAPADGNPAGYVVAVRTLCEFTAKRGDLDLRFTPSPSAQEGIAGHAAVAARRPAHYQSEITLAGDWRHLHVRGRADGYDPLANRLEEVKTFRGDLDAMPENHRALHRAQLFIYGWLLCDKLKLNELRLALVYFDIVNQQETVLEETRSAQELRRHFEEHCERFLHWAGQELAHRARRDAALAALRFPYPDFRRGQRQLAEAVYRAAGAGRCLMAQAPTGIGKTMGTLFPLLKACPGQKIDKIFFLAAKTSGRRLALDALGALGAPDADAPPLRVLELVARDKACEHPDKACHGESCPLAAGFYDRLPAARSAALELHTLDQAALRAVALRHEVCPYYLAQDLARWSDVVIGDYNYYFDLNAMLHGLTAANQWRVGVLVDEAHNLLERARRMYSAELDQVDFAHMRRTAPAVLKRAFARVNRCWNELHADGGDDGEEYRVHAGAPSKFLNALTQAVSATTDYLAEHPQEATAGLQQFYFDALHFTRVAELFGEHSLFDVSRPARPGRARAAGSVLCLRNVLPAPFLAPRFAAARTVTLFSATLSPWHFYGETLGLPADTPWIDVESPFSAEQLTVKLAGGISTRYRHRQRSIEPIVALIAAQYAAQPGNYLAFFSSFDYLEQVAARFAERHGEVPVWLQSRRMEEKEKDAFLARFAPSGRGIGFAVLGGSFGEGIDLPGDRLIGAFIATLGLPQFNPVNEEIRKRMDALLGAGYDYTYFYPGIQKVVQAAGRVIRTGTDRGVIHLIDDRFAGEQVLRLLPGWWQVGR